MPTRAVLLSSCCAPQAIAREAALLAASHDEVIVAIDDAEHERWAPLPVRWHAMREQLQGLPKTWATPLAATPDLPSRRDRYAALRARLGPIDLLLVESDDSASAERLGLAVRQIANHPPEVLAVLPTRSRALLVTRAQPFHLGHLALVEHALSQRQELVLVVAAAERAFAARDPFSAGERLAMVRAGLAEFLPRTWLVALPSPGWPAMALLELALLVPSFDLVVAHNPVLRALAAQQQLAVSGLPAPLQVAGATLTASRVRASLIAHGAAGRLQDYLPAATAELLYASPALAQRCAVIAAAG